MNEKPRLPEASALPQIVPATISHADIPEIAFRNDWSFPESTGRWTDGPRACMAWTCGTRFEGDLLCHIDAMPALHEMQPTMDVSVFANDCLVAKWHFRQGQPKPALTLAIPRIALASDRLNLSFEIERPLVPLALGISGDARALGLHVRSFRFEPCAEGAGARIGAAPLGLAESPAR